MSTRYQEIEMLTILLIDPAAGSPEINAGAWNCGPSERRGEPWTADERERVVEMIRDISPTRTISTTMVNQEVSPCS